MTNLIAHERAIILRKKGGSIKKIAQLIGASVGSVSAWCRNVVLTDDQIDALKFSQQQNAIRALLRYAELRRDRRMARDKEQKSLGMRDVENMSKRDLYFLGLGLYWGEGYKRANSELGFTNSDSEMVKIYIKWLEDIFAIKKEDLIFRISINISHSERLIAVERYWRTCLTVESRQFTKTSFVSVGNKKLYSNKDRYFGTLRVKVRKAGILKERILGAIDSIPVSFDKKS